MREVDVEMASTFLTTLAPKAVEFTFQTFSDRAELKRKHPKTGKLIDPHARIFAQSLNDASRPLIEKNKLGVGVFVTVNGTSGGGRTLANFKCVRALFADMDGAPSQKWPIEPTMVVESSPGKRHVYWCLADEMPLETWRGCMRRIVEKHGADSNAADPVRVLRLPGFFHCKADPVMVRLVKCGDRRHATAQLVRAFPPVKRMRSGQAHDRPLTEVDQGALRSALEHLAATPHPRLHHGGTYADDYETWMRFGLAIKRDLGDEGFDIWDEWGRFSDRYPGRERSLAKWNDDLDVSSRAPEDAIHVGSIFHTAKRQGWSFARYQMTSALEAARAGKTNARGQA